jgi:hypothetical protein
MIEKFRDKKKEYRFRVKARNGKIIAQSEGYKTKKGCERGIDSLINNLVRMNEYEYRSRNIKDLTEGV